jgi:hypothetical protein
LKFEFWDTNFSHHPGPTRKHRLPLHSPTGFLFDNDTVAKLAFEIYKNLVIFFRGRKMNHIDEMGSYLSRPKYRAMKKRRPPTINMRPFWPL